VTEHLFSRLAYIVSGRPSQNGHGTSGRRYYPDGPYAPASSGQMIPLRSAGYYVTNTSGYGPQRLDQDEINKVSVAGSAATLLTITIILDICGLILHFVIHRYVLGKIED
jgi:hypothetical protein